MALRRFWIVLPVLSLIGPWLALLPLTARSQSWQVWDEAPRILQLALNTAELSAITVVLALPPGIVLAILLFRTDMPGAKLLRFAMLFGLFLPLPMWAAGWQAALRWVGFGASIISQQGILVAAAIHALAALPWVVWLIGLSLRQVDREREETALLSLPAPKVLARVTLAECRPALALAAFGVVLQCLGEMAITDLTGTRTLAEEIYLQFSGDQYGLEHSIVLFLPLVVMFAILGSWLVRREGNPLGGSSQPALLFRLGPARWPLALAVALLVFGVGAVPFAAILWRASNGSAQEFIAGLLAIARGQGSLIGASLFWSACAALLAASAALALCWRAQCSRIWRQLLFSLAALIWVTPGPVVGFGVNSLIQQLLDVEDVLLRSKAGFHPLKELLYNSPSPLPVLWAQSIRIFPLAVVLVWPAARGIAREQIESAQIDGAHGWQLFRAVAWPACRRSFLLSALAGLALAMGELSATKIAQVPGRRTFIEELFSQMHYGADATVARLCLVQLALSGILVAGIGLVVRKSGPRVE
jgi:iron(III) transport system permease protein